MVGFRGFIHLLGDAVGLFFFPNNSPSFFLGKINQHELKDNIFSAVGLMFQAFNAGIETIVLLKVVDGSKINAKDFYYYSWIKSFFSLRCRS